MPAHPVEVTGQRSRQRPRHRSAEDFIHAQAREENTGIDYFAIAFASLPCHCQVNGIEVSNRSRKRRRQSPRRITSRAVYNAADVQSPGQEREDQQPATGCSPQQSGLPPIGAADEHDLRPETHIRSSNSSSRTPDPTERVGIDVQLANHDFSSTEHVTISEPWLSFRHPLSSSSPDTLRLWSSWHFVRTGLITAQEAVTYIDLFFQNMNSLSPILHCFYSNHMKHGDLISREPVLCCAIIALSARYHILEVHGAVTRGFYIHDRLWEHCQTLFQRLVWNQRRAIKDQMAHLGTIESLLLAAEWHPRCVHLPIETEYWQPEMALSDDEQTACRSKGAECPACILSLQLTA